MAIARQHSATLGVNSGSVTTLSVSYTVNASSNKLLVAVSTNATSPGTLSVTYNGVSCASIVQTLDGNGGSNFNSLWYLDNPATGAHTLLVTANSNSFVLGCAADYSGCAPGIDASVSHVPTGSSPHTVSVTPKFSNDWVYMLVRDSGSTPVYAGVTNCALLQASSFNSIGALDSNGAASTTGAPLALTWSDTKTTPQLELLAAFSPAMVQISTVAQTETWTAAAPGLRQSLRTAAQTETWTGIAPRLQQSLRTTTKVESWSGIAPRLQQSLTTAAQTETWTAAAPGLQVVLRTNPQTWTDAGVLPRLSALLGADSFAWQWEGLAPSPSAPLQVTPQTWTFAGVVPGLSASLQSSAVSWGWLGSSPGLSSSLALAPAAWDWVGVPPTLPFTLIEPPPAPWDWAGQAPQLSLSLQLSPQPWTYAGSPVGFYSLVTTTPQPWDYAGSPVELQSSLTTTPQPWTYAGSPVGLQSLLPTSPQAWATTGLPVLLQQPSQVVTAWPHLWTYAGVAPRVLASTAVRLASSGWGWPSRPVGVSQQAGPLPVQPVRSNSLYAVWGAPSAFVPPEDPPDSAVVDVWSSPSRVTFEGLMPAAVVYLPNSPYIAGTTFPVYGQLVDIYGKGIPASQLVSLTLTIFDTLTGIIMNGISGANILNTDRGTVDESGNLTILNEPGDTSMSEVPGAATVQRSYGLNWVYNSITSSGIGGFVIGVSPIGGSAMMTLIGAQQINFTLLNMNAAQTGIGGFQIGISPIGVGAIG